MKKLFVFLFASMLSFASFGQVEWAENGTYYNYAYWTDIGGSTDTFRMAVEVVEDTLVQGKDCKLFHQMAGVPSWNWGCAGHNIFFEEDGRVFFFHEPQDSFRLLYDFNKTAGESWDVYYCGILCYDYPFLKVVVDSVTATEINGTQIKTQHVHLVNDLGIVIGEDRILENIGSATRMFLVGDNCPGAVSGIIGLTCYGSPATGALEIAGTPCAIDEDADGYTNDVDCDDTNPDINPCAPEIYGNGVDEDCDGIDNELPWALNCTFLEVDSILVDSTASGEACELTIHFDFGVYPPCQPLIVFEIEPTWRVCTPYGTWSYTDTIQNNGTMHESKHINPLLAQGGVCLDTSEVDVALTGLEWLMWGVNTGEVLSPSLLNLYPNPVAPGQVLHLSAEKQLGFIQSVEVYSMDGKAMAVWQGLSGKYSFDLPVYGFAKGEYLVQIGTANGVVVKRFQVH